MTTVLLVLQTVVFLAAAEQLPGGEEACPPWFILSNSSSSKSCVCGNRLKEVVKCEAQKSYLAVGYCMTYDSISGDTVVGKCPYNTFHNIVDLYLPLPVNVSDLNNLVCGPFNREGQLCGDCKDGYGPAVLSYAMHCGNCEKSRYGLALYFVVELLSITLMFLIVAMFRIKVTSSPMNAFVLFSQVIINILNTNPTLYAGLVYDTNEHVYRLVQIALTCYGIWNLDFFLYLIPPFCISSALTGVHLLAFQYIVAFYPILLLIVTYICIELHDHNFKPVVCIWRPFYKCFVYCMRRWEGWEPKASIVNTFAAFLLLSYSKILFVSLKLLIPIQVYNNTGMPIQGSPVLYYDPTVQYFGRKHAPFAICAIMILLTFVLLPSLLLILYPTRALRKYCNCCGVRRWDAMRVFVECFQGWLKDGTNNTRDFRIISALYLLLKMGVAVGVVLVASLAIPSGVFVSFTWFVPGIVFIASGMFYALARPYKQNYMNTLDSMLLALLGVLSFLMSRRGGRLLALPLGAIPVLCVIAYGMYKVLKWTHICRRLKAKLHSLMTVLSQDPPANFDDDSVPDRLIHPQHYRQLTESANLIESQRDHSYSYQEAVRNSEQPNEANNVRNITPVYTYGSIH